MDSIAGLSPVGAQAGTYAALRRLTEPLFRLPPEAESEVQTPKTEVDFLGALEGIARNRAASFLSGNAESAEPGAEIAETTPGPTHPALALTESETRVLRSRNEALL